MAEIRTDEQREEIAPECLRIENAGGDVLGYLHGQVSRAIPVDGFVGRASWEKSPQVRFWLEPEKKTLLERFVEWLNK